MADISEGLTLSYEGPALVATAIRRDVTRIEFFSGCLEEALSALAEDPSNYFVLDDGLVIARPHIAELFPKSRYSMFSSGESGKTLHAVSRIIDELRQNSVHRKMALVSVGGGVTCDTTGLIANLYFRGISVRHVPTTLLSMVDAAIGGKVAVNHPEQKNLIGAFYHPCQVLITVEATRTQSDRDFLAAFGEIIKLAMVDGASLWKTLETGSLEKARDQRWLTDVVAHCVESKIRLLGTNAFERDLARQLNFGHSIAHPLEDITSFRLSHGEAVAIGISVASALAYKTDMIGLSTLTQILNLIRRYGLPTEPPPGIDDKLLEHLEKLRLQRGGRTLHYVMPQEIGSVSVRDDVVPEDILKAIRFVRDFSPELCIGGKL